MIRKVLVSLISIITLNSTAQFERQYFWEPNWIINNDIKSISIGSDSLNYWMIKFEFDKIGRVVKKTFRFDLNQEPYEYFEYNYKDTTISYTCEGQKIFENLHYHGIQFITDFPIENDFHNKVFSIERDTRENIVTVLIYDVRIREVEQFAKIFGSICELEWFDLNTTYILKYKRGKVKKIDRFVMDEYLELLEIERLRIKRRLNGNLKLIQVFTDNLDQNKPELVYSYEFNKNGSMQSIFDANGEIMVEFGFENELLTDKTFPNKYHEHEMKFDISYEFWSK